MKQFSFDRSFKIRKRSTGSFVKTEIIPKIHRIVTVCSFRGCRFQKNSFKKEESLVRNALLG